MINTLRLLRTVSHLRARQVAYRIRYRLFPVRYRMRAAPETTAPLKMAEWIPKAESFRNGGFEFLNIPDSFRSWTDASKGMLWAYNLNYMDWLCQPGMDLERGSEWIDRFIAGLSGNAIGRQPYPTALRGINWIKFVSKNSGMIAGNRCRQWNDSLYSQYARLVRMLEFHLSGNHLLEDAFSLFIASLYFRDKELYRCSSRLLWPELNEQVLPDGAHYEQSPMYHCILLDRLLDCYNCSANNAVFDGQKEMTEYLGKKARQMLGHLVSIVWKDQNIPLLNDSACGIATSPAEIFRYARRLGLEWTAIPLSGSGYRRFSNDRLEVIADVGQITASYQPGHTHADIFSYEMRINGNPFVVDTGISTYEKNERRQYERSTAAHNAVSVRGKDSIEVWGGFRVGRRPHVKIEDDSPEHLVAVHDGFGKRSLHVREFSLSDDCLIIADTLPAGCPGISYLHFAPDITVLEWDNRHIRTNAAEIRLAGAGDVEIEDGFISLGYNCLLPAKSAKIYCRGQIIVKIVPC